MEEEVIFILSGPHLYAECYKSGDQLIIDVKDNNDESLVESIRVNDRNKAMEVAFNATVGKYS